MTDRDRDALRRLPRWAMVGDLNDRHMGPKSDGNFVRYEDVLAALDRSGSGEGLRVVGPDEGLPEPDLSRFTPGCGPYNHPLTCRCPFVASAAATPTASPTATSPQGRKAQEKAAERREAGRALMVRNHAAGRHGASHVQGCPSCLAASPTATGEREPE